ncbi:MAG: TylF/MycF/NovP-related O-methyltransferase [Bradyrhizobium sp.]|jgi:O-methyltransferase
MEAAALAMVARNVMGRMGLDISRQDNAFLEPEFTRYHEHCAPFTMVSRERLYAHFQAVRYVVENNIDGDIVECGVWRGGTSMLGALTLLGMNETSRQLWLYDTFAGMTAPTDADVSPWEGANAIKLWRKNQKRDVNKWCYAPIEEVKKNLTSTSYPAEKTNFVKGDVVETLKASVPNKIAVLRLDTDWYESTRAEMEVLFPRLVRGGVILIDDYGAWKGCKKAVDEYLGAHKIPLMLHRTDYTGRSAIKAF